MSYSEVGGTSSAGESDLDHRRRPGEESGGLAMSALNGNLGRCLTPKWVAPLFTSLPVPANGSAFLSRELATAAARAVAAGRRAGTTP